MVLRAETMGMRETMSARAAASSSFGAGFGALFSRTCRPTFSTLAVCTTPPDVNVLLNSFCMRSRSSAAMPSMLNFCLGAGAGAGASVAPPPARAGKGVSPRILARSSIPSGRARRAGGAAASEFCSIIAVAKRHL